MANVGAAPAYQMTRSLIAIASPAPAPASSATGSRQLRYRKSAKTSSAPSPCTSPASMVSQPHCVPMSAETVAATTSV